jgi:sulfide dehydrogenase [flavocytochrome c] flavoprotein chain
MIGRRDFLAGTASFGLAAALPKPALAQSRPKVVIVGGGPGGGTVLRALAASAAGKLDITLIEARTAYTAYFHSNLYLGGLLSSDRLKFTFDAVTRLPGVTVVHDVAQAIDREARNVVLAGGKMLPYDVLVLSPGIGLDYNSVQGWSKEAEERMPHAWKGGPQLELLKRQLDAVPDAGLIVVLAPPMPYRCPPGPYERVSMMAHALKAAGKLNARIVILDAKESFSMQPLFHQGWERLYPGMVEWMPPSIHSGIKFVDPATMTVETGFESYKDAALVNVIPRQTAGALVRAAGLTDEKGYGPIDPFTMKSRLDQRVFVVGDACVPGDMPKSAFAASSQGQAAAMTIKAELLDKPKTDAEFHNTCWSAIDKDDSVKIGGDYRPTQTRIQEVNAFISKMEETGGERRANYQDSASWYAALTSTLFA